MNDKLKSILITGSEGLIGRLLSSKLSRCTITSLDQVHSNSARYVRSNLQSVSELNDKLTEFLPFDCVVHLAAECNSRAPWNTVLVNNIIATRTIFEFARENKVPQIIFASSNHVTGLYEGIPPSLHLKPRGTENITSEMPICPDGYYGVSKAFGEALGKYFSDRFNIRTTCLRIGSVLQDDNPSINKRYRSTWLSHDDLVMLFEAALNSNVKYGIYYGVSNNKMRFWDLKNAEEELNFFPQDNADDFFNSVAS